MKHKVAEIDGALLDAAVALAEGIPHRLVDVGGEGLTSKRCFRLEASRVGERGFPFAPSQIWNFGGPIIERERISVLFTGGVRGRDQWEAYPTPSDPSNQCDGPTPLIAAMRAFVKSKLGDEVDLP